jgi:hypothetical protein
MSGRPQRYYGNGELPAPSSVMPTSGNAPDVGHPSSLHCYNIAPAIPPPQIGPTRPRLVLCYKIEPAIPPPQIGPTRPRLVLCYKIEPAIPPPQIGPTRLGKVGTLLKWSGYGRVGPISQVSVPPTVFVGSENDEGCPPSRAFREGGTTTVCARCFALQQKSSHVFVTSERCLRSQQPCLPKATISRMSGRPQRYHGNGELPAPSSVMPTSGKAPDVGHPSSLLCYKIELAIPPPQIGPTRRTGSDQSMGRTELESDSTRAESQTHPAPSSVMPTSGKAPDVGHPSSLLCYKIEPAIPPPQIGPARHWSERLLWKNPSRVHITP